MVGGLRKITDDVYVAGQISPADIPALVETGIKSILNNRPDGESPEQPTADDVRIASEANGLTYGYVPMAGGQLSLDLISDAAAAFEAMPKPILAHCAGGMRSALLWAFSNVKKDGVVSVLAVTSSAGFTFEQFRPMLEQYAQD